VRDLQLFNKTHVCFERTIPAPGAGLAVSLYTL